MCFLLNYKFYAMPQHTSWRISSHTSTTFNDKAHRPSSNRGLAPPPIPSASNSAAVSDLAMDLGIGPVESFEA